MGTLITLRGSNFTDPDLPVAQIPYQGLTNGLLAAHHLRSSLESSVDLSGNSAALIENGSVEYFQNYVRAGGGQNGFISQSADLSGVQGEEFTICTIARRGASLATTTYGFPICSYADSSNSPINSSAGTNIQIRSTDGRGGRPQSHVIDPGDPNSSVTLWSGTFEEPTSGEEFEVFIMTCSYSNGRMTWYQPKYDHVSQRTMTTKPVHQLNYANQGSRWLLGFGSESTQNASVDVAYVAIFDRELSASEVETQYQSMVSYANAVGITGV